MSWLDKLVETYELNAGAKGLVPPFHTEFNAQIIVTLSETGEFITARIISDKKARSTVIPCTEASAARAAKRVSHPLFDSLMYIAGDLAEERYLARLPEKDREKKSRLFRGCFEMYLRQLQTWCAAGADTYVCTVRDYLNKKRLCGDLIAQGLLPVDGRGALFLEKPKEKENQPLSEEEREAAEAPIYSAVTGDLSKTVVLFEIERRNQWTTIRLWESPEVRESWQNYYASTVGGRKGFCQIFGREMALARLHPKRICSPKDQSKIISGNDKTNFTYRGRFETAMEASAISIEASQKAHSALRWLLAKQGCHEGSQYMVAWAVDSNPKAPDPLKNTVDLLNDPLAGMPEETELKVPDTAEAAAHALKLLIAGYSAKLNAKGLCFMVLDAATTGTLAVKLFRDLEGALYLKNIRHWHSTCAWLQEFGKEKRFYGAPAPRDIVRAAYGEMKPDDPRLKSTVTRLLPCILDGLPIPRDIADCVIHRASRFKSVKEKQEFRKNLSIACAIYRYNQQTRRQYTMALDPTLSSRDYLYGRLLAVADYLESSALTENETNRPTNAMRLMTRFADRPYSTWRTLATALNPYKIRLTVNRPGKMVQLDKLLEQIHNLFSMADYKNDRPLSGEYLLGYYCQKQDFFTKKNEASETSEEN